VSCFPPLLHNLPTCFASAFYYRRGGGKRAATITPLASPTSWALPSCLLFSSFTNDAGADAEPAGQGWTVFLCAASFTVPGPFHLSSAMFGIILPR